MVGVRDGGNEKINDGYVTLDLGELFVALPLFFIIEFHKK